MIRALLRKQLRQRRQNLSPQQQKRAKNRLSLLLKNQRFFLSAKTIGFYWPSDGEIDPRPLIHHASRLGKRCYLVKLHPNGESRLLFSRWKPGQKLIRNRFSIPESNHHQIKHAGQLDLLLIPLVGFDNQAHRLGMGGGFYDRSLALAKPKPQVLVGLGHRCQQWPSIAQQDWDIALDFIATDGKLFYRQHR